MKIQRISLLMAWLSIGVVPFATRADDTARKRELKAQYAKRTQAFKNNDIATLNAMVTSDFAYKAWSGNMEGKQFYLDVIKLAMKELNPTGTYSLTIKTLTIQGDKATATVAESFTDRSTDKRGKSHKLLGKNTFREIWIKTTKGWKLKRVQEVTILLTKDGKPIVQHSALSNP